MLTNGLTPAQVIMGLVTIGVVWETVRETKAQVSKNTARIEKQNDFHTELSERTARIEAKLDLLIVKNTENP